jgi:murein L,D-transpeptidase YafK
VSVLNNRLDDAMNSIDQVIAKQPNYRLAHLIKGDILMARAKPLSTLGNASAAAESMEDLRQEARVRLNRYLEGAPLEHLPRQVMQLAPNQRHALLVDTSRSRLYVFSNENGEPKYLADYYVTIGKNGAEKLKEGDQRTPVGVYNVVSEVPKATLTDFYGSGAFPINYPNEWDQRQGRNGHGIWLHGTPSDTYARAPRASNGCVVLTNPDFVELSKFVDVGNTPVVISAELTWLDAKQWHKEREELLAAIETWREDWASLNTDRYLAHYGESFTSDGRNRTAWAAQKRAVNEGKRFIKVELDNVAVFNYPGTKDMVVVTFDQQYHSNNLSNRMKKRQYWQREGGDWKIIHEGAG